MDISPILAKWVSTRVRDHLEEILEIARTFMAGFGLLDDNSPSMNQANFKAACTLSTYLHLHHIPKDPQELRVSLRSIDLAFY
jgi:hypothetical protein